MPAQPAPTNSMGLPLDTVLPTDEAPSFSLFGPTGVRKSTEAGRLGSRIFYVQTNPDALRLAFQLYQQGLAPQPPIHRLTLDETYCNRYAGGYYYVAIREIVARYIHACDAGTSE